MVALRNRIRIRSKIHNNHEEPCGIVLLITQALYQGRFGFGDPRAYTYHSPPAFCLIPLLHLMKVPVTASVRIQQGFEA